MSKYLISLIVLFALLFVSCSSDCANYTIYGKIKSEMILEKENIDIRVRYDNESKSEGIKLDENGEFKISYKNYDRLIVRVKHEESEARLRLTISDFDEAFNLLISKNDNEINFESDNPIVAEYLSKMDDFAQIRKKIRVLLGTALACEHQLNEEESKELYALRDEVAQNIDNTCNPLLKKNYQGFYLNIASVFSKCEGFTKKYELKKIMSDFGYDYAVWPANPAVLALHTDDNNFAHEFLMNFFEHSKDEQKKSMAFYTLLKKAADEENDAKTKMYLNLAQKQIDSNYYEILALRFKIDKKVMEGKELPSFKIQDLKNNSKYYTNKDFYGKYLYIYVWSTYCKPCVQTMPDLIDANKKLKDQEIEFLNITVQDDPEKAVKYIEKNHITWLNASAPQSSNSFYKDLEIIGIPQKILVNPNGKVISVNAHPDRLENLMNEDIKKNFQVKG